MQDFTAAVAAPARTIYSLTAGGVNYAELGWQSPVSGLWKMNCDATVISETYRQAAGVVIRDKDGEFRAATVVGGSGIFR